MRSPQTQSPHPLIPMPHFHSSVQKLCRLNLLILVFRAVTFCFSFASSMFMLTNSHSSPTSSWSYFDSDRYVFAANAIVAIYSLLQMVAFILEVSSGVTLFCPSLVRFYSRTGLSCRILRTYYYLLARQEPQRLRT